MRRLNSALRELSLLLVSNTFAACLLAGVFASALLGFVFGAEIEVVIAVLILSLVTALIETRLRAK